jgi:hypothetical protein
MALTSAISGARQTRHPKTTKVRNERDAAINHAVRLIHAICGLAGPPTLIDEIRADLRADKVRAAIRSRDTGPVFDWLMAALSYQGISDQVAFGYMEKHGRVTWRLIKQGLDRGASCPKLKSYWQFHDCRYDKISRTCAEPDHIRRCLLPNHDLRNGRLNQTAYCLFLFIRDIADGDLIGWIDRQLKTADGPRSPDRLARMRASLIEPLRQVYGVSDHGPVLHPARCSEEDGALDRGRRQHDRHRHAGSQFSAPDRDPAAVQRKSPIRRGLLPARGLCRHSSNGRRTHRCQAVQPLIPAGLSPVRSARNLAVLQPERPRCLQRQPDR